MIIQTAPMAQGPFFAIRMDEHTDLAAQFARAFGNDTFEPVEPRDIMLDVIANHDKGWVDFDADPETDPRTGLPYNLVDTPAVHITKTSAASPDFNARRHPYAGLISSMHSWGLYNGRYGMSEMVLIDTIAAEQRHLADRMLEGEISRQKALKLKLAADPQAAAWISDEHVSHNYKQLQFFDTLALYFNRTHEGARKETRFTHVPVNASMDVTVTIAPRQRGVYALSPYPFAESPAEFAFAGRYIEPLPPGGHVSWRATLHAASVEWQRIMLVPG
jgi:hypothetical protein